MLTVLVQLNGQDSRARFTQGINIKFTKSTSINASLQNAYRPDFRKLYSEYSLGLNYRVSSKTYIRPSLQYTYVGRLDKVKAYRILGLRISQRLAKNKLFRTIGRLKAEYHSENQYRYRMRLVPSLVLRSKRFKIDDRLRLNISVFAQPYLIFGGNEISQYDAENEYMGEYKPAGFHRLRLGSSAGVKYDKFFLSVSWFAQREFNLFDNSKYKINQRSKKTGKINHKFREYNAFSVGLTYMFNWDDSQNISNIQEQI